MLNRFFDPELFVILTCNPANTFTQRVIDHINRTYIKPGMQQIELGKMSCDIFPGGEPKIKIQESIRKKNVHIFQCFRQTKLPFINQDFMELLVALDAIRRARAAEINIYLPYMPYLRQEKKVSGREPLTAKLGFNLIEKACGSKCAGITTMDIHSKAEEGFPDVPVDILNAWPLFASYVINRFDKDIVVVAPDAGAAGRARKFAEYLGCHFALIEKKRVEGKVTVYYLVGEEEVVGKKALILDDMIATAGTLLACKKLLLRKGATEVWALGTHGLLNPNDEGIEAEKRLCDADIKVIITDTIPEKHEGYWDSCCEFLDAVLSAAGQFGNALYCNETGASLSQIMKNDEFFFSQNDFLSGHIICGKS